jgi:hypothetical protein
MVGISRLLKIKVYWICYSYISFDNIPINYNIIFYLQSLHTISDIFEKSSKLFHR